MLIAGMVVLGIALEETGLADAATGGWSARWMRCSPLWR